MRDKVGIRFSDVMWTIQPSSFDKADMFRILNEDVTVVQPLDILHSWKKDDDNRILELSFDIASDIIDFGFVPELYPYDVQARTIRDKNGKPYYDHWSDRYMKIEFNETTRVPRLTLKWDSDCGFNFETIYLRWRLPAGFRIMDTIDRLMGYSFSTSAENIEVKCNSSANQPQIDVAVGHVVPRVPEMGTMYLGLEHSTSMRRNGYVLKGLGELMTNAIKESEMLKKVSDNN